MSALRARIQTGCSLRGRRFFRNFYIFPKLRSIGNGTNDTRNRAGYLPIRSRNSFISLSNSAIRACCAFIPSISTAVNFP
uniref:Uncharacterized protein n=1 Tax=Candidatus Kentrum sp. TC TaxID=2126339 RepID=A0A450YHG4_9GAMM|nr:MAG: hypothetical protein BECKTC1821E_GA0114239_10097 [Candidatus Kentron sp. TC]